MSRAPALALFGCLAIACSPANVGGPSDGGVGATDTGGGPLDGGGDGGTSIAQACADFANARCGRIQTCSPTAVMIHYGVLGTCVSIATQYCLAAAAAPETGTTLAGLEACVSHVSDWACGDAIFGKNPPPQCMMATGGLPTGASCAIPTQCQTGFCSTVPGAACGVCAPAPVAGDSCASLTTCGPNFVCTSGKCEPYSAAGGACSATLPCDPGLSCVFPTGMTTGTCQPAVTTSGTSCVSKGAGCDLWAGLACNSTSLVCDPLMLGNDGDQCGYVNLQNTACLNGICVGIVGAMPGTCSTYAALGAACDLVSGPFCVPPSRCVATSDGGTTGSCLVADATKCH
jgi:hypothetical protein